VLLTERRFHEPMEGHWIPTLSRLLQPQGVTAHVALSGSEAMQVAQQELLHAAVVDLALSERDAEAGTAETAIGGLSLVRLLRRLPAQPVVVALRGPVESKRQSERLLSDALRFGAFSVIDHPVDVERLLAIFRRLVDRHYQGAWPEGGADPPAPASGRSV